MFVRSSVGLAVVLIVSACDSASVTDEDGGVDAGSVANCTPATRPTCCEGSCANDVAAEPVCSATGWTCPSGSVQCAEGQCTLPPPSSSLRQCADPDAGVCLNACDQGEVCFTQIACGPPLADGGSGACTWGMSADAGGDNRCHRSCAGPSQPCGGAETCQQASFFGCGDYNGSRYLCCPASGCP